MESGNLGAVSPTSVWVFVDSTEDHDLNGRLASPAFGITTFSGVLALITRMEQFYNEKRFPQSSMQIRSFHKKKRGKTAEEKPSVPAAEQRGDLEEMLARIGMEEPGKRATFVISVLFRQNATWQGSIQWLDKKKTQRFRSTLELIQLMDSALDSRGPDEKAVAAWNDSDAGTVPAQKQEEKEDE